MNRRRFLYGLALAGLAPQLARAHHGWSGFQADTPVYIRGRVTSVKWQNPHAELVISVPDGLELPAGLAERTPPAQQSPVDGTDIFRRTVLPPDAVSEWTIELAPLFRVNAWEIEAPSEGDEVEAIGYIRRGDATQGYMRAEYLFIGNAAYGLRSGPA